MANKFTEEQVAEAAKEALGRSGKAAFDKNLYESYKDFGGDLSALKRAFAESPEAQTRGIDVTKYGGEYVNFDDLNDKEKEKFSAYQRGYGKDIKVTKWMMDMGRRMNAELIEAEAKGGARVTRQGKNMAIVVDADTWNTYGNRLFSNRSSGDAIYIEKSDKLASSEDDLRASGKEISKRWKLVGGTKDDDKYYILQKAQAEKSGLVGSTVKALGGGEGMANSLDKAVGDVALPVAGLMALSGQGWALAFADEAAAIGGGTRGAAAYSKVGSNLLRSAGLSKGDAERGFNYANAVGDVAQTIGAGFADSVTFGAATAANLALEAVQKSATNQDVNWEDVGRDIAISWASFGIGQGLGDAALKAGGMRSVGLASTVRGANRVWNLGGRELAVAAAQGKSGDDLAWAAGRGLVMGAVGDKLGKAELSALSWGLNYADAKRQGMEDEAAYFTATAGMASTLTTRMGKADPKGTLFSRVKSAGTGLVSEGRTILNAARTGEMPETWGLEAYSAKVDRYNKLFSKDGRDPVPGADPRADALEAEIYQLQDRFKIPSPSSVVNRRTLFDRMSAPKYNRALDAYRNPGGLTKTRTPVWR